MKWVTFVQAVSQFNQAKTEYQKGWGPLLYPLFTVYKGPPAGGLAESPKPVVYGLAPDLAPVSVGPDPAASSGDTTAVSVLETDTKLPKAMEVVAGSLFDAVHGSGKQPGRALCDLKFQLSQPMLKKGLS